MNHNSNSFQLTIVAGRAAEAGNWSKACSLLSEACLCDPLNIHILLNYAEALINREKWGECRDALTAFQGDLPDRETEGRSNLFLGISLVMLGEHERGRSLLDAAHNVSPSAESWNYRGIYAFLTEDYGAARHFFEEAVKLEDKYQEAWFNLADTCEMTGDWKRESEARQKLKSLG